MLFQGQELGSTRPFVYFADHDAELARRSRPGRREFLSQFPSLADAGDPAAHRPIRAAEETFARLQARLERARASAARAVAPAPRSAARCGATTRSFAQQDARIACTARCWAPRSLLVAHRRRDATIGCCWSTTAPICLSAPAPEPLLAPPAGTRWRAALVQRGRALRRSRHAAGRDRRSGWRLPGDVPRWCMTPGSRERSSPLPRAGAAVRAARRAGARRLAARRRADAALIAQGVADHQRPRRLRLRHAAGMPTRRYHGLLVAVAARAARAHADVEPPGRDAAPRRRHGHAAVGDRSGAVGGAPDRCCRPRWCCSSWRTAARAGASSAGDLTLEKSLLSRTARTPCCIRYRLMRGARAGAAGAGAAVDMRPHDSAGRRRRRELPDRRGRRRRSRSRRRDPALPPLRLRVEGGAAAIAARRTATSSCAIGRAGARLRLARRRCGRRGRSAVTLEPGAEIRLVASTEAGSRSRRCPRRRRTRSTTSAGCV